MKRQIKAVISTTIIPFASGQVVASISSELGASDTQVLGFAVLAALITCCAGFYVYGEQK